MGACYSSTVFGFRTIWPDPGWREGEGAKCGEVVPIKGHHTVPGLPTDQYSTKCLHLEPDIAYTFTGARSGVADGERPQMPAPWRRAVR